MPLQRLLDREPRAVFDSESARTLVKPCPVRPNFRPLPPPVIVIGMHRSGTSVVAAMLAKLGVYMGAQATLPDDAADSGTPMAQLFSNGYGEAAEFMLVNERLLELAGSTWRHVDPFLTLRDDPDYHRSCIRQIQRATRGLLRRSYLRRHPAPRSGGWGWKDPRNSLTLKHWLRAFPTAQVLHVRRDMEASAASLHRRAVEWSRSAPRPARLRDRLRYWTAFPDRLPQRAAQKVGLVPKPYAGPDPCLDLDYCRRLAAVYTDECLRMRRQGGRWREIWYEEILNRPLQAAELLAEFVGTECPPARLNAVARLVRPRSGSSR